MAESITAERDSLRAALETPAPAPTSNAPQSSPATSPTPDKDNEGSQQTQDNQQLDNDGTQDGQQKTDNQTKYEKAKRGRERLEDIRRQAEEDKRLARQEREALERVRSEFKQELSQRGSDPDGGKFTAKDLARAASWYSDQAEKAYDEGDLDKAKECRKNAKLINQRAQQVWQQENLTQQEAYAQNFVKQYSEIADDIISKNPDLANQESEAFKAMDALLESAPILTQIPDGFKWAWQIVQLQMNAGDITGLSPEEAKAYKEHGKAAGLLKKITELNAEVKRLTGLTSLERGSSAPLGGDNVNSLPLEKQRDVLRARASGD